jgi:hypothetical protein
MSLVFLNISCPPGVVILRSKLFTGIVCSTTEGTVSQAASGLSKVAFDSAPDGGPLNDGEVVLEKPISNQVLIDTVEDTASDRAIDI